MPRPHLPVEGSPIDAARTALVRDIMTPDPVTIRPDTGLEQVIELFVSRELSHAPVVGDDGRAVGMVSKTDLVRDVHLRGVTEVDALARDVMTPIAMWVPEIASVAEAARVIASGQLHALVVASADGRVVGILSAVDIAAWVAGVSLRREWAGTT